jgi:solute carrier family 13 (sodium-dependent dicarboxylate transporter), member 2/3/5
MLPVATPPNAIVHGSGRVSIPQMARAGFLLNLATITSVTLMAPPLLQLVFGR